MTCMMRVNQTTEGFRGTICCLNDDLACGLFEREMGRIFNAPPEVRSQIETLICGIHALVTCLGDQSGDSRAPFTGASPL